jgi:hypothetical protein
MNPLEQYQNIKILSDPRLFQTRKKVGNKRRVCALWHYPRPMNLRILISTQCPRENRVKTVYFSQKEGELPIVINSGASYSVTLNINNFVGPIRPCSTNELNGLNAKIRTVVGDGDVQWKVQDVLGTIHTISAAAYYVPDAGVRLFSPQLYFMKHQCGSYFMDYKGSLLTLPDGTTLQFPYNNGSSLPLMLTTNHFGTSNKSAGLAFQDAQTLGDTNGLNAFINVVNKTNQNLTSAKKELLLVCYQRLGHADFQNVQRMLCQPRGDDFQHVLTPNNSNASACSRPLCAA